MVHKTKRMDLIPVDKTPYAGYIPNDIKSKKPASTGIMNNTEQIRIIYTICLD